MVKTLGYMVTWTTYGTWLQGDEQGYVKKGKVLGASKQKFAKSERDKSGRENSEVNSAGTRNCT